MTPASLERAIGHICGDETPRVINEPHFLMVDPLACIRCSGPPRHLFVWVHRPLRLSRPHATRFPRFPTPTKLVPRPGSKSGVSGF
ncbi:hypothetical protein FA13DRAFT_1723602, partial [Coprinellus micaceus]